MMTDFSKNVLKVVGGIHRGQVMTYLQVAQKAGSPRAFRAVGNVLHQNFRERSWQLPKLKNPPVPCHRVIRSDGRVGGYARGTTEKERLLRREGLKIEKHKIKI